METFLDMEGMLLLLTCFIYVSDAYKTYMRMENKGAGCYLTQELLCSSLDMQPREAPHCTQLQQDEDVDDDGGGGEAAVMG